MAITLALSEIVSVVAKYLHQKKPSGVWFYHRRVPADLRPFYSGKSHHWVSLQTKDKAEALKALSTVHAEVEREWARVRQHGAPLAPDLEREASKKLKLLGYKPGEAKASHFDNDALHDYFEESYPEYSAIRDDGEALDHFFEHQTRPIDRAMLTLLSGELINEDQRLSFVLKEYLKDHSKGAEERFRRDAERAVQVVINAVGDLPLGAFTKQHARAVRDALEVGHKSGTVKRRLATIKAVFNFGFDQLDVEGSNKFKGVGPTKVGDEERREVWTRDELLALIKACRSKADELAFVAALAINTGARLGELVGLRREDVLLDHEVPHIRIREDVKSGRTLKTNASVRDVPLVGISLWAAEEAMQTGQKGKWLFPRWVAEGSIRADSASGAIGKWFRRIGIEKQFHGLRHTIRDRLREADVPVDAQDKIGGWSAQTVGQQYGTGASLQKLKGYLERIEL